MPLLAIVAVSALVHLAAAGEAPVIDAVPAIDIEAGCRADALASQASGGETLDECVKDERDAKAELESKWSSYDARRKRQCSEDLANGDSSSYLELTVCVELQDWMRLPWSGSAPAPAR